MLSNEQMAITVLDVCHNWWLSDVAVDFRLLKSALDNAFYNTMFSVELVTELVVGRSVANYKVRIYNLGENFEVPFEFSLDTILDEAMKKAKVKVIVPWKTEGF